MDEERLVAGPQYAIGRLVRALEAAAGHSDPHTRQRALAKAERWRAVLDGMAEGHLEIGSRVPVADTPAWVTLEVEHGGFATGRFLAEGPLLEHEVTTLATLPPSAGQTDRERLNLHYLGDAGQEELLDALARGAYRVQVPEEGALAVVAWLVQRGHAVQALELVDAVRGLLHRLRFYPALVHEPRPAGACLRLVGGAEVRRALSAVRTPRELDTMNATLGVWNPLYERLVELWGDTVEGEPPRSQGDGAIVGGWPARVWPSDWIERRDAWMADYTAAKREHGASGKHHRPKGNFARLRQALERCPSDASALTPREIGFVRVALAGTTTRHGLVGSAARVRLREAQAAMARRVPYARIAERLVARLAAVPDEAGVPSLEPYAAPLGPDDRGELPEGTSIPPHLVRKVGRALEAPITELIERGVIGSGELLALVLPQITARIAATAIADPIARDLYEKIYVAFRRRRSLLLLNLEHQVRIEELPWVAALEPFRGTSRDAGVAARRALDEVTLTALTAFPHQILPNRLVREMGVLVKRAKLNVPLVEEVAADIFMGTFTTKWAAAGRRSCESLEGSLYARYYDLPAADDAAFDETADRWGKPVAPGFAALCERRAVEARVGAGSPVAQNGTVIEQSQILTTHNLAPLVDTLELHDALAARAPELVARILTWIARRHRQKAPHWRARLQMVKNTAYAWRQGVYFLSLVDAPAQRALVAPFGEAVAGTPLAAAARGLERVIAGERFDTAGKVAGDASARRFLGWSVGQHWLLG